MAPTPGRPVNNALYDTLGERWYAANDDPVALLRAESRLRNPWVAASIRALFPGAAKILDLGCGAGFLSNYLASEGFPVEGLDASADSLAVAARHDRTASVRYVRGDAYSLPHDERSFDVVCAMDFLEHVEDPERVIAEAARVLRPGGLFFFHTFNRNPLAWLVVIKGVEWFVKNTPRDMHVLRLFLKPEELHRSCRAAGFELVELRGSAPVVWSRAFWQMLLSRSVPPDFRFQFCRSTLLAYTGYARRLGAGSREPMPAVHATTYPARTDWRALFVHLRLHYQLLFLSPLFAFGFLLGGGRASARALLGFLLFHLFLYGGITAYNSYYDRDEGPVGGLRHPPKVSEALLGFSLVVQCLGLALAPLVGFEFTLLYLLVMVLSVAYSHPRFRWKARPLLALLVVAFGQGAVGFLGGWLCGSTPARPWLGSPQALLGCAATALITVGLYPLTQLYQVDEDRARGDRTFAVEFGANASFGFALGCVALGGACLVPLVKQLFGAADAWLIGGTFAAFLGVIAHWRRRFRPQVEDNFRALHRLQALLSLGILGYIGLRLLGR